MSFQDEMAPDDQQISSAFVSDLQKECRAIRTAVNQFANACARIELFDPQKVVLHEFIAAGAAFQKACRDIELCMINMQSSMERHGA